MSMPLRLLLVFRAFSDDGDVFPSLTSPISCFPFPYFYAYDTSCIPHDTDTIPVNAQTQDSL